MATNQPISTGPPTTPAGQGISGMHMRSYLGLLAALSFLVGVPLSFGWQILFGSGAGTMIHFFLAAGTLLLAFAVFDFQLPRWMNWIGCAAGLALGSIFFLQAVAPTRRWVSTQKDGCPMWLSFGLWRCWYSIAGARVGSWGSPLCR